MRRGALMLALLLGLLLPAAAHAEPRLTHLTITNTRDHLLIYTDLTGAFVEKVEKAVKSGVETTVSFDVDVFQQKRFWFDKRIATLRTRHRMKFDVLKKNYAITRSWATPESFTTESFDEAKQAMSRLEGVRAADLAKLVRGEAYHVKARARLEEFSLPVYLRFIRLFADLDTFETEWHSAAFVY